jgi:hypothetical protein
MSCRWVKHPGHLSRWLVQCTGSLACLAITRIGVIVWELAWWQSCHTAAALFNLYFAHCCLYNSCWMPALCVWDFDTLLVIFT